MFYFVLFCYDLWVSESSFLTIKIFCGQNLFIFKTLSSVDILNQKLYYIYAGKLVNLRKLSFRHFVKLVLMYLHGITWLLQVTITLYFISERTQLTTTLTYNARCGRRLATSRGARLPRSWRRLQMQPTPCGLLV